MIISILLITIIALFIVITKQKNKYTFFYVTALCAINILIFSLMIFTTKLTLYRYIFQLEFYIYRLIAKIKISFYDIGIIINFAVSLFVLSIFFLANKTAHFKNPDRLKYKYIAFIFIVILYNYLNSPSSQQYLYLMQFDDASAAKAIVYSKLTGLFNIAFHISVLADASVILISEYMKTSLVFKKLHLKALGISLIMLLVLFYTVFFFSPIQTYIHFGNIAEPTFSSTNYLFNSTVYLYLPCIIIAFFSIIIFFLVKYRLLDDINLLKKLKMNGKRKINLDEIRHLFHTYKNSFVVINSLSEKVLKTYGSPESIAAAQNISKYSENLIDHIGKCLDIYNRPHISMQCIDITDCISETLLHIDARGIDIVSNFTEDSLIVFGDRSQLSEMFYNIISNSIDAIISKAEQNGRIEIICWREDSYICTSIKDNGCGMDKKICKNIFQPFWSTKRSRTNLGLGLSHAYKIISCHQGFINCMSSPGKYTEFQIVLPAD